MEESIRELQQHRSEVDRWEKWNGIIKSAKKGKDLVNNGLKNRRKRERIGDGEIEAAP